MYVCMYGPFNLWAICTLHTYVHTYMHACMYVCMVQITHKLNGPCVSHMFASYGVGVVTATAICTFVMGHACTHTCILYTYV